MESSPVGVGQPVRPGGSLTFGTIGCLAEKDGEAHLVTCDHVIRTLGSPETGPLLLYPPFDGTASEPMAEFRGLSLSSPEEPVADMAAATLLVPPPTDPGLLPPGSEDAAIGGLVAPEEGMEVRIWGARTRAYHRGRIASIRSERPLPHPRYGLLEFELQFSIEIDSAFLPEVGDSGGPIIAPGGRLVGILTSGPHSCTVMENHRCIAYGVPALEGLKRLGLEAMLEQGGAR